MKSKPASSLIVLSEKTLHGISNLAGQRGGRQVLSELVPPEFLSYDTNSCCFWRYVLDYIETSVKLDELFPHLNQSVLDLMQQISLKLMS